MSPTNILLHVSKVEKALTQILREQFRQNEDKRKSNNARFRPLPCYEQFISAPRYPRLLC